VITKCTMLFQLATGGAPGQTGARIGGWSESWYNDQSALSTVKERFFALCQARAAMLPTWAQIVGQRYQQVVPKVTSSQVASLVFPGTAGLQVDVPQMSVLVKIGAGGGNPNIRQWAMRGLPDARVENGEFLPSLQFTQRFQFFSQLLQYWLFRGVNLLADQAAVNFIDANGEVQLNESFTVNENDRVQVIKTMNTAERLVGGIYQVGAGPTSHTLTLRNWDQGLTQGGTVRLYQIIYPTIDPNNIQLGRVTVRKVGRPFFSYRGRRSNRR